MTTEEENGVVKNVAEFCRKKVQSHQAKVSNLIADMQDKSTEVSETYSEILLNLEATNGALEGMNRARTYLAALEGSYQSVLAENLKAKTNQLQFAKLALTLMQSLEKRDWKKCKKVLTTLEELDDTSDV